MSAIRLQLGSGTDVVQFCMSLRTTTTTTLLSLYTLNTTTHSWFPLLQSLITMLHHRPSVLLSFSHTLPHPPLILQALPVVVSAIRLSSGVKLIRCNSAKAVDNRWIPIDKQILRMIIANKGNVMACSVYINKMSMILFHCSSSSSHVTYLHIHHNLWTDSGCIHIMTACNWLVPVIDKVSRMDQYFLIPMDRSSNHLASLALEKPCIH